jgi:glucose-1-phosphate thymidylyltransferase
MLIICPIAGVGSRLHPLTITKPKAMIKIAGKKIMDHLMNKLKNTFPKRTKVCFIVGYKKKTITSYLTNNYSEYFDIMYHEQTPVGYKNEIPFFSGLGDAINLAGKEGRNDDCFIFLSDRLPMDDYTPMVDKMFKEKLDGVILVRRVDEPSHYGVCVVDSDNIIKRVVEKPKEFVSNLAISGAYIFSKNVTPKMFSLLDAQAKKSLIANQEHQFTDIIQKIIDNGAKLGVQVMQSPILDFGRVSIFLEGNHILLNSHPSINENYDELIKQKKIQNTSIIPPVYIGKNCVVSNSVLGPNVSIGDNVILTKCILTNVVIGDCSTLENVITENSIVGDFVSLESMVKNRISIGDSSTIATTNNF